jgi:cytoskeletal protein RodZ
MFIEKTQSNNSQDLKKIREDLGLSLEDLFQRTRVRVAYLQAIENKEYNLLPVPVYTKNFIKIYASALGVDIEPLIKEYEEYLNSRKEQPVRMEEEDVEKFSFVKIAGKKTYLIIAIILIAVIATHWLISKKNESTSDIVNPAVIKTNPIQEIKEHGSNISINQQIPAISVAKQKEDVKQSTLEKKTTEISEGKGLITAPGKISPQIVNIPNSSDKDAELLSIRAIEETWLRVKADQDPSFQILLKVGDKFEHKAKSFEIDVGNAGGIKIRFNGKEVENIGKSGQVVHLRLP